MSVVILVIAMVVYFLPSIVAYKDKRAAWVGIAILNVLLGWTILGWIAALIWAVTGESEKERAKRYGQ
jgi:uncharacterized membrane protein